MTSPHTTSRHDAPRIAITGVGLISPLGLTAWETFAALLAGRSIADRPRKLPPGLDLVSLVRATGSVAAAQHVAVDPTVELAERAAREALTEAGASPAGLACFIGTSKGAVSSLPIDDCRLPIGRQASARAAALGPCGYLSHELRRRLGLGQVQHYVAACASSLHALHAARQYLLSIGNQQSPIDNPRVLVLTAESAMLPAFIHSYHRLGVLAPPEDYAGRPYDQRRQGFMLCEIGAAVVLERVDTIRHGQTELLDTAVACEAHDLIRPSPTMPALRRIAARLFAHGPVYTLHPHAPGTQDHDLTELNVLHEACGSSPLVYANKGALGHSLGAAGLVSLVLACLCARTGRVPPMPWLQQPIEHPLLPYDNSNLRSEIPTHAIFAAGFGGHVAGALIHRHAPSTTLKA